MPRYLSLVRIDESTAPAEGPSPEMMQRMGELLEEITKAGVMLDTAGRRFRGRYAVVTEVRMGPADPAGPLFSTAFHCR